MILTDGEIREIDTSEYWFEHTPHEFAREIEKAVLVKLLASGQETVNEREAFEQARKNGVFSAAIAECPTWYATQLRLEGWQARAAHGTKGQP
jgi:hypothetical protein